MTAIAHSVRKHALLSASGSSRWWHDKCPNSVNLSRDLPEPPSSEAAQEGTRVHEWAEFLLREGACDAREFIGPGAYNGAPDHVLTAEMADAINIYLDAVWDACADSSNTELYIENTFSFPGYDDDLGGTGDACVINTATQTLDIFDFKNGWFTVAVENNTQLLQYALGAVLKFPEHKITTVRLNVIQPRESNKPKVWVIDRLKLFNYTQELRKSIAAVKGPNPATRPGEHCTFCPAAYHQTCTVRREHIAREAAKGFATLNDAKPGTLPRETLAALAAELPMIEKYAELLRDYMKAEFLAGRPIPGKKIVAFQMRRVWALDDETTAATLQKVWSQNLNPWVRELHSPAEVQKMVGGKAAFEALDAKHGLTRKFAFGSQIVDESDPRPALQSQAAKGFTAIGDG